jgi:hypothetical protein
MSTLISFGSSARDRFDINHQSGGIVILILAVLIYLYDCSQRRRVGVGSSSKFAVYGSPECSVKKE